MSGFLTGLLNISLMIVLGLTLLIDRGQRHAAVADLGPESILSAPEPERFRLEQDAITENKTQKKLPEFKVPDVQADMAQIGAFFESWMKRLSLELYSAVGRERPIAGQRLRSIDGDATVAPSESRKIRVDPNLLAPIVIPADKEPIAVSAF